ncbi:glutamate racemase [Paenibacillus agricola]|uniref:Glutamate racemase n=1 Tax=Paenibacillus agricola TaxID=2716264 RepID=A0ABX0JA00_9BACL|nr:glutamate racemase [Paenibacillus agricola]NHN32044.1 glutamate racemase [Paenibacillus agricola]
MRIAFFDSGLGGITVLHEGIRRFPQEDFLYYADTLHVPYGTKPKDEVKQYIFDAVDTMMKLDIKALVVACNTATSIAIAELRLKHPSIPIIGMEPAVKPAVQLSRLNGRRVLVLATPLTLRESKYIELVNRIDDMSIVDSLPLPELVEYCESLQFDRALMVDYFTAKFAPYRLEHYGTVVLGCTHYPFYRQILSELLPKHIQIIDGSIGTVNRLGELLNDRSLREGSGSGMVQFACSDNSGEYRLRMKRALDIYQAANT